MLTIKNWAAACRIFLLGALVLSGCTPKGPRSLLAGKEAIEEGQFAEAVEELQVATTLMKTNAGAWNYLGIAYQHSGMVTNAEEAYSKALSLDRNLAEAHYNLGTLRMEAGRFDAARTSLIAYTALRANAAEGWLRLGTAQFRLRDLTGAEKSFETVLRLDDENAEALNALGVLQLHRRNPRQAAVLFNRALDAQTNYGPALLNLAIVNQTHLNNPSIALQKYREYLSLPDRPGTWSDVNATAAALARELNPSRETGVSSNTVANTLVVPSSRPLTNPVPLASRTNPPAARSTPVMRSDSTNGATPGRTPAAQSTNSATTAVRSSATSNVPTPTVSAAARTTATNAATPPGTNRSPLLRRMNPANLFRGAESSNPASRSSVATESKPDSVAAASNAPRYKYRNPSKPPSGDEAAAERSFTQGARAQQENRLTTALNFYREATEKNPAYFEAHYNLAVAATKAGNLSQALTAYESALAIRPDSLDARYNFGVALKQSGYVVDSIREMENLLSRYPRESRAHVFLGNLYAQQLRQNDRAREYYIKALDLDPHHPQAPAIRYWLSSQ
jgi:Flp pilus assembly protein TadD